MQPITTALLSFGMSGQVFHAPFLQVLPHFHLYAVWERSSSNAQLKYPGIKTFRSLDELLQDPAIELVVVNTPNYTHYPYTKAALLAGKHVIVEKPFTVNTNEGQELIRIAADVGKVLSVYHNRRYDSDYKTVAKVLREGQLGDIVEAEFHFDRYKEELSPKKHKETPGAGTGALYDLGSHLIDQALQMFGKPSAVFSDIQIIRSGSQVDDFFEVLFYYPDKRVRLRCSYLVREALPAYILHGKKGSFIKAKTDVQEKDLQAGKIPGSTDWGREPVEERGLLHTEIGGKIIRNHIASESGDYGDYYHSIYAAVRDGVTPEVTAQQGLDVVNIIEKAFQSQKERKVIML